MKTTGKCNMYKQSRESLHLLRGKPQINEAKVITVISLNKLTIGALGLSNNKYVFNMKKNLKWLI